VKKIMAIVVAVMLFIGSTGLAQAICEKGREVSKDGRVVNIIVDKNCDRYAEEKQQHIWVRGAWHIAAVWCWDDANQHWDPLWEVGDGPPINCPD